MHFFSPKRYSRGIVALLLVSVVVSLIAKGNLAVHTLPVDNFHGSPLMSGTTRAVLRSANWTSSTALSSKTPASLKSVLTAIWGESDARMTSINGPTDLAYDKSGILYIVEMMQRSVLRLNLHRGTIRVVIGEPGKKDRVNFRIPNAIATDSKGDLYIADFNGRLRKLEIRSGKFKVL